MQFVEFVLTRCGPAIESFDRLSRNLGPVPADNILGPAVGFGQHICGLILDGKATANAAPTARVDGDYFYYYCY